MCQPAHSTQYTVFGRCFELTYVAVNPTPGAPEVCLPESLVPKSSEADGAMMKHLKDDTVAPQLLGLGLYSMFSH
jgi:hypothetical protein